jgi:hypothetical protein
MKILNNWLIISALALSTITPALADDGSAHLRQLSSDEIHRLLTDKWVTYSWPGMSDTGVHEEFHKDGVWRGIHYGYGPSEFLGEWTVADDELCVTASRGMEASHWKTNQYCRKVWENEKERIYMIFHLMYRNSVKFQALRTITIHALPVIKDTP